jgi:hypothetical protein
LRSLGEVYVVVAPAAISASSTLSVKVGKAGRPQAIRGNGTEQFYFLATTTADGTVDVEVSGGALSGLWLYAKSASSTAAATHTCGSAGYDTKGGQCLHVRPCDAHAIAQQFERQLCSHWNPKAPVGWQCLSHRLKGALEPSQRHWLNSELWSPATCDRENGA